MSRFVDLVVLCLVAVFLHHCEGIFVKSTDSRITYIGRTAQEDSATVFSWPGVQIVTKFSGATSVVASFQDDGDSYFDVLATGVPVKSLQLLKTKHNYTLFESKSSVDVNITIIKRTETYIGVSTFYGFYINEGATLEEPAPRRSRRIEFVGASITLGYGNLGTPPCHNTPSTENSRLSASYLVAEELDAEVMITAWSGIGIIHNNGDKNNISVNPMPSFYNNSVAQHTKYGYWDFKKWVPQAVVINLGTNDFSDKYLDPALYIKGYIAFVNQIRKAYDPTPPKIFLQCGPMTKVYCAGTELAANKTGAIALPVLPELEPGEIGCDNHPNIKGDQKMASLMLPVIAKALGW